MKHFRLVKQAALVLCGLGFFIAPNVGLADSPSQERFRERIPVQQPRTQAQERVRRQEQRQDVRVDNAEWIFEVMPVLTVMFFDEDRDRPMPGGYFHARRTDLPLNFRVGIEGTSYNSEQRALEWIQIEENRGDDITFLRIPFAVEYWHNVDENLDLFAGPAYNIIHMDNLADDTGSGLSLSGRAQYSFTDHVGLSVEGGYLFAEQLDTDKTGKVDFDGAFVSTGVSYRF